MKIDWQSYLDGSLSPEEMTAAEKLLESSPDAQQELEGLKHFKSSVKAAVLSESIPHEKLDTILSDVVSQSKSQKTGPIRVFKNLGVAAAMAAAAAILWFGVFVDPNRLNRTPTAEVMRTHDPVIAASWVHEHTGMPATILDLDCVAEMTMVRYGQGWACYDFVCHKGNSYNLYVSVGPPEFLDQEKIQTHGQTFYLARGVGWTYGDMAFYVRGPEPELRLAIAQEADAQIRNQFPEPIRIASGGICPLCEPQQTEPEEQVVAF